MLWSLKINEFEPLDLHPANGMLAVISTEPFAVFSKHTSHQPLWHTYCFGVFFSSCESSRQNVALETTTGAGSTTEVFQSAQPCVYTSVCGGTLSLRQQRHNQCNSQVCSFDGVCLRTKWVWRAMCSCTGSRRAGSWPNQVVHSNSHTYIR